MITYDNALTILRREVSHFQLAKEMVYLSAINGRVSAANIISPLNIPSFDNSAMDGFAVCTDDFESNHTTLKVKARIIAGDAVGNLELSSGTCYEIMTGASIPKGANSIIPVESANKTDELVSFSVAPRKNEFIREAGSDFRQGVSVIDSGTLLRTHHILPLAALGIGKVAVYSKPKVAFIPTGREIVDGLNQSLGEGQIYNSTLPFAEAFLSRSHVEFLPQKTIADDPDAFQTTLSKLADEDVSLIISSGAVSVGSHDFIYSSLEEMGATILFHKVAIKPGKPILFARLPKGIFYLGLPGNPISTAVGLRFFVRPLLAALMQQKPEQSFLARVKTPLSKQPGLRLFLKAKINVSSQGVLEVSFLDGQESYKTSPFLIMNSWAMLSETTTAVAENDVIEVFPLS
ncbi:MAG: hypothetical protein A3E84_03980 [Gammaproteobacteria bacterium RIFCSPHIGHO2_12_FULL_42_13]|nr:MAG: hypothetical protein A3E84_03980 [Gammaproteobacteria bacterium RIFCSPHIGHO2_12_FULL_42_13]